MRKVKPITITDEGRDKGKTFVLTEMPADQGERWALRALLALTNAGVELPDGAENAGMAGLAAAGIRALAKIPFQAAEPLLDEMFQCVQYQHNKKGAPLQEIIPGANSQIEEISTRIALRVAILELHTGFSLADATRTTGSQPPSAALAG